MLHPSFNEMTLNEQAKALATQYAPNRFPEYNEKLRTWEYFNEIVPKDNWEGFND